MPSTSENDRDDEHRSGPEDLAAEYIAHLSAGESADKSRFLARCADDRARAEFEALIRGAERVERSLPRALVAGTVLSDRYRILAEIGGGGMSRVFAALDLRLERRVAVKVPLSQNIGNKEFEELFVKESKLLASLQHPNIVSVHESGRDGDLAYIVMDLVDGASLAEVIERARKELGARTSSDALSPRDGQLLERAIGKKPADGRANLIDARDWYASIARIMLEVARTIEAAHSVRVIHRDLKPGNVMLVGGGNPVVLDFGLAGSSDLKAGTVTQGLYGSVAYLAPEQAQSNKVGMDPRTDVYQLGLILYELLTLRRAFPGTAIGAVLGRIKDGTFSPPRKVNAAVPRDLEAICMMALELDPARRYDSARALREDFERYVAGNELPLAVRSNRWRRVARAARQAIKLHPWAIGLAATVLISGIVGYRVYKHAEDSLHTAPVMVAFRVPRAEPGSKAPPPARTLSRGDSVEPGDRLGITVNTNRPLFLYVFSIFDGNDGAHYFAPMHPELLEDTSSSKRDRFERYCVEVKKGPAKLACTRIASEADQYNPMEGLLVFASTDPRPDLEKWMTDLGLRIGGPVVTGVLKSRALEILRDPPLTRGGEDDLSPEQRKTLLKQVEDSLDDSGEEFELPGLYRMKIECPVAKAN